jgi:rubredoxin
MKSFTCNNCDYEFWLDTEQPPLPHKGELYCPSCGWKTRDYGKENIPNWKMTIRPQGIESSAITQAQAGGRIGGSYE